MLEVKAQHNKEGIELLEENKQQECLNEKGDHGSEPPGTSDNNINNSDVPPSNLTTKLITQQHSTEPREDLSNQNNDSIQCVPQAVERTQDEYVISPEHHLVLHCPGYPCDSPWRF